MLHIYRRFILETTISLEHEVPTVSVFQKRISKVLMEGPWLVCEFEGKVIAYAYASKHRERIGYRYTRELSVYVSEAHSGNGIASGLYTTLMLILIFQGYKNVLVGIVLPNEKSVAFHEKMGFKLVGIYHSVGVKFGKYVNVGWWELELNQEPPTEIIHWKAFIHKACWEKAFRTGYERIRGFSGQ